MRQTTQITIEHMVVTSDRTYEQVIEALEAQLGLRADWENIARALLTAHADWEQAVQIVEQPLGTSGFTILSKIEPGALLTLSGKPTRAAQYAIGNPLLAIQMIEHAPEVALLVLLDTYYGQSPTLRFPEFVSLFADPAYTALTRAIIQNPAVAQWLLAWQGGQFGGDEQVQQSLLSIIGPQFVGTPSTFPPFIGLTSDLHATVQATT